MADREAIEAQLRRELAVLRQQVGALESDAARRREVESALRSEIDRLGVFERVVDESPDGFSVVDRNYIYQAVNRRYVELHGRPVGEIVGHSVAELLGESTFEKIVRPNLDRCFRGERVQYESWFAYAVAGRRYMEVRYNPLHKGSRVEYAVVVIRDTTERKQVEATRAKLAEERAARAEAEMARQRINSILESITDAFFALDREWRFTYVNREAERLLRKKRGELLGKNVWAEFPEAVSLPFYSEYHKAMSEQLPVVFEALYPPLDTWYEVRAYPSEESLSVYFHDIGQRKRTERALRESEARYRSLYRAVEAGIVVHGPDGRIVDANHLAGEVLGLTREQMFGLSSMDPRWMAIHEDDSPFQGDTHPAQVALRTGERVRGVIMGVAQPDGERRWLLVNAQPIHNGDSGAIAGSVATFMDITQHKRAEESMARLAAIVESSHDAIYGRTLDGVITSWNPAAERLYGYVAEEAIGKPLSIIVPADRHNELVEILRQVTTGERIENFETVRVRKDGQPVDVSLTISQIRDAAGRVIGVSTIARDIAGRKRAEQEREWLLAEAERRAAELDATISAIPDGLIIFDEAGAVTRINPAAQSAVPFTPEELGIPFTERLKLMRLETVDGRPFPEEELAHLRALRGETVRGVVVAVHPPQSAKILWHTVSAAPVRTPEGRNLGAVLAFADITQQRELQERLQDVLRTVSHDLRNPLGVVLGQAQLIRRYADRPEAVRKGAEAVVGGARMMEAMIQDLVDAIQLEGGRIRLEKELVHLRTLVLDLLDRAKVAMEVGRVKVEIDPNLSVHADPNRLERIVTNLISNALKYSESETEVNVAARKIEGEVLMEVSDRGIGIGAEDLPHIFERFYEPKARPARRGLGLGMYITKMLVEAHGGQIWVESEPGKGSKFFIRLPQPLDTAASSGLCWRP